MQSQTICEPNWRENSQKFLKFCALSLLVFQLKWNQEKLSRKSQDFIYSKTFVVNKFGCMGVFLLSPREILWIIFRCRIWENFGFSDTKFCICCGSQKHVFGCSWKFLMNSKADSWSIIHTMQIFVVRYLHLEWCGFGFLFINISLWSV